MFKKLKLIIPVKYKPKKIIMTAIILENICDLLSRNDPKRVEDAPSKIKIIENPKTNKVDFLTIKYLDCCFRLSKSVPQIKER